MKRCPYCAEKVQDKAMLCRFCGKELPKAVETGAPPPKQNRKRFKIEFNNRLIWAIVISLCVLPCIALVLSWGIRLTDILNPDPEERDFNAQLADARQSLDATATAVMADKISTITDPFPATLQLRISSTDGEMEVVEDYISDWCSGGEYRDFVAEVTFANPQDAEEHRWDYGLTFRDSGYDLQYRLVISSSKGGRWYLNYGIEEDIQSGYVPLRLKAGQSNTIKIFALEDEGYLYVNGSLVSALDLSQHREAGNVCAATGLFTYSKSAGTIVHFTDFQAWEIIGR